MVSKDWREHQKKEKPKTKADFHAMGYHPPDHWFDKDGNFIGVNNNYKR